VRVTVTRTGPIRGLAPRLDRAGSRWAAAAAQDYVDEHESRIRRGVRPDGRPQKRNAPSTIRRKGSSTPLVASGALAGESRIIPRGDTQSVELALSEAAVRGLEALGYLFVGPGPALSSRLQRTGSAELRRAIQ
jgi:hypothetical protein